MDRSKEERQDQLPSVEDLKASQGSSPNNSALVRRYGWLQSTTCLFLTVLTVGFLLGFVGMTIFIETEDPLSKPGSANNGPNNSKTNDEPQTLESRMQALLGVTAPELFVESTTGYQTMAVDHMKQKESIYITYSDERLQQVYGLLCLYYATNDNGNGWLRAPSWHVDSNECQWEGIRCSSLDEVVEIDLTYIGLDGVVPHEITLVESVIILRLDNNPGLTGNIPAFLGHMNLLQLSVTGCGYVGEMPNEICELKESNPNVVLAVDCALVQCDAFCCDC